MRDNIRILWIEDAKLYYEENKEILEIYASDRGIKLNFEYIQEAEKLLKVLEAQETGFMQYDICFIDYALSMSDQQMGDVVIKKLKEKKIDADILFYSSDQLSRIRDIIKEDIGSFEGVYISDRHNFEDKAKQLINKNAKKMYSINNIRGILMNETSENDYIMKSYIINEYENLDAVTKTAITEEIKKITSKKIDNLGKDFKKINTKKLFSTGNEIIKISNDLLSLEHRYVILNKILEKNKSKVLPSDMLQNYLENLVSLRNKLAHRKLEICAQGDNILHYNHIKDYNEKCCKIFCDGICKHPDDNKVNIEEWNNLRKQIMEFGEYMDKLIS